MRAAGDAKGASCCQRPRLLELTRPPADPWQASRELLAQLLFEQFNVAGVYFADAPVMALYAAGRLTGIAVDVGADKVGAWPRQNPRPGRRR